MKALAALASFIFCFCFSSFAQPTGQVKGLIKDEGGKPIPSVTVSLLKAKDSSLVTFCV